MCGRYFFFTPADIVAARFGLEGVPPLRARYNVAPPGAPVFADPQAQVEGAQRRVPWQQLHLP